MLTISTYTSGVLERFVRSLRNDRGTSLVEYVLLLSLLALVCFVALRFFGGAVSSQYSGAASSLG
jgi:Flp pilus assembly pilin Flp